MIMMPRRVLKKERVFFMFANYKKKISNACTTSCRDSYSSKKDQKHDNKRKGLEYLCIYAKLL